ncbi:hypothetical protein EDD36DRAFT_467586 [Exophiala viscosa]|uniref:Glycosyl hydrolases family 2 sugar binding domain-containing protein n=1 Tax=Exophiala viscosa TaxID=2486360 RepID=A0AAN6ICE3_9EURO|nr:hypothetical protein EDD36DRAFT_467586 [Exophiala viscosa]
MSNPTPQKVFVEAGQTFTGSLPLPVAAPSGNETANPSVKATPFLAAVLVAKTSTTNESATVVDCDPSTVQLITSTVSNDTISWTAPDDGTYILVAAYGRGNPEAPLVTYPFPAYIVDHFSSAGVNAGIEYWSEHILTDELRALLNVSDGSIFEDSLELKYKQYWTMDFLADPNTFSGNDSVATQITNAFYQTVSDLYTDYRGKGIMSWANSLGLKFRLQPYTGSFDSCNIASVVDIPEGESLGFEGDNDAFRVLATGRDVGGRTTILSDELGAYGNMAYGVTWRFLSGTYNLDASLGVSQGVIHGFPYRDSPDSQWPGFAPFTPLGTSNGFADAWGPRQPHWMFANNASLYMANAAKLLQDGGPSVDIAILNQDWGVTATWADTSLNDGGALLVNETAMDVSTAELLLSYGKAGLPIIFLDQLPNTTFSFYPQQEIADATLASVLSQIQGLSTTKLLSNTTSLVSILKGLGVTPSVQYTSGYNVSFITHRRTMDSGYLYWVYNNGDGESTQSVSLEGTGSPYAINLWTGDVEPITSYISGESYVTLNVTLAATAAAAIYVGTTNPFNAPTLQQYLVSTGCGSYVDGTTIHLISNVSCSATTSAGKTVSVSPQVQEPVTLTDWTLVVQDWGPAVINETGLNSSLTVKTTLPAVSLTSLAAWPNITGLQYASGLGYYNTTASLNLSGSDVRVLFGIGSVDGEWSLTINGKSVPGIDQFSSVPLDVTDYVVNGDNNIEILVATTLWNKLIEVWPAIYGTFEEQLIGLLGPVTLTYVQDVTV